MKCVICRSGELIERQTEEEIRMGNDIVFVAVSALVCKECGEKYYNRSEMRKLEGFEKLLRQKKIHLERIGKVLKPVEV